MIHINPGSCPTPIIETWSYLFLLFGGRVMNDCAAIASKADTFNYRIVRQFALMTVVWGIVGMAVGVFSPRSWFGLS
ncbi:hypothetical protein WJ966_00015 [Achromobacter xylosoxidans]